MIHNAHISHCKGPSIIYFRQTFNIRNKLTHDVTILTRSVRHCVIASRLPSCKQRKPGSGGRQGGGGVASSKLDQNHFEGYEMIQCIIAFILTVSKTLTLVGKFTGHNVCFINL